MTNGIIGESLNVMPAQAGIQNGYHDIWIPAFAGITGVKLKNSLSTN